MTAILFGILFTFASCKDSKQRSNNNDANEEKSEQVKSPKKSITKISSLDDLKDVDLDDIDVSELDMDDIDFDKIDLDNLSADEANLLLQLALQVASKELPEDLGDGSSMESFDIDGDDVVFTLKMDVAGQGITMEQFAQVIEMPEMKGQMIQGMMSGAEDDDMALFLHMMVAGNKNLSMKFVDKTSGKDATLRLKCSELKQLLEK
ncbi:MAG: hypothetical protein K5683_00495 [Prevotella sp.]|nr:hypothetical protein [Prevotella sp.]